MHDSNNSLFITRRGLLTLAAGASVAGWTRLYASSPEFWEKKSPADWTAEEIDRLLTRSPWAKQVAADFQGGGTGGRGGGMRLPGGISFPGGGMGGRRGGMGGGRGGRGGEGGAPAQLKGTVRWESAKPILEALKTPLPESFANHYVISVTGFPLNRGRYNESGQESSGPSDEMLEHIKALTSLQPKGKALAQAGVVQSQLTTSASSLLFGFAKDLVSLDRDDKEVLFSTQFGRLTVRAKFTVKEMAYRGELAV